MEVDAKLVYSFNENNSTLELRKLLGRTIKITEERMFARETKITYDIRFSPILLAFLVSDDDTSLWFQEYVGRESDIRNKIMKYVRIDEKQLNVIASNPHPDDMWLLETPKLSPSITFIVDVARDYLRSTLTYRKNNLMDVHHIMGVYIYDPPEWHLEKLTEWGLSGEKLSVEFIKFIEKTKHEELPFWKEKHKSKFGPRTTPSPPHPPRPPDYVPTHRDGPAKMDFLGRKALAKSLAKRLRTMWDKYDNSKERELKKQRTKKENSEKQPSYDDALLVNIHGPWGSGKSTLLNFLRDSLKQDVSKDSKKGINSSRWIVIDFNAWKYQRIGPPWWSLIDTVFRGAFKDIKKEQKQRWRATKLWFKEKYWRFTTGRSHYYLAIPAILWVLAVIIWLFSSGSDVFKALQTTADYTVPISTILAFIGTIWATTVGVSHSLLPGSARAARSFMEQGDDPQERLKKHFREMVMWIEQPIAIFIDDLDRCSEEYTVELLEGIQTMFKEVPVTYVIAADKRWLSTSYEKIYSSFAGSVEEPGRPLGYLFLEKTFQFSVSLPRLSEYWKDKYWRNLIQSEKYETQKGVKEARDRAKQIENAQSWEIAEDLYLKFQKDKKSGTSPFSDLIVRDAYIARSAEPDVEKHEEHFLLKFRDFLEPNPRAMKRLVNAYRTQKTLDIIKGGERSDPNKLALWTILVMRWPRLAEYLEARPGMIEYIGIEKLPVEDLPPELKEFLDKNPGMTEYIDKESKIKDLPKEFQDFIKSHRKMEKYVLKRTLFTENIPEKLRELFQDKDVCAVVNGKVDDKSVVPSLGEDAIKNFAGLNMKH
jgi:hypothetical protein